MNEQHNDVPQHVAIIMDGNGRWAKSRFLPRSAGHHAGGKTVRRVTEYCAARGVAYLTLYAFSTENWQRPPNEVETLMQLLERTLDSEAPDLQRNNIRLRILGSRAELSSSLCAAMDRAEAHTAACQGMQLILAVNYGGRQAIMRAAERWAQQASGQKCDEASFARCFDEPQLPPVDLLIRSSGEQRISNFLLWESAYAELYFSKTLWPDFDKKDMDAAFDFFAGRERRFGKI